MPRVNPARLSILLVAAILVVGCSAKPSASSALDPSLQSSAESALQTFSEGTGSPYRNPHYSIADSDGTFSTVVIVAEFRSSVQDTWKSLQLSVPCRKIGKVWQCDAATLEARADAASSPNSAPSVAATADISEPAAASANSNSTPATEVPTDAPAVEATITPVPTPRQMWEVFVQRIRDGEEAKTTTKLVGGEPQNGWRYVYLDVVVGETFGAFQRFSSIDAKPQATVIDSKGYSREGQIFQQPYGLESNIDHAPPLFRLAVLVRVELPESSDFQPATLVFVTVAGEEHVVAVSDAKPSLTVPIDERFDPTKRAVEEMPAEAKSLWEYVLGKPGEAILLSDGVSVIVKSIAILTESTSGGDSVVVIPEMEIRNDGGNNAYFSWNTVRAVVIDNHGHVSGPTRYSTGLDHGILDGGTLPPGQTTNARLTAPLLHPVGDIEYVWLCLFFGDEAARCFYVKR